VARQTSQRRRRERASAGGAAAAEEAAPASIAESADERRLRRRISLLFLLSGTAALVCEVVWMRALGLVVGSEAQAASAVLSAWFVGTAAGAAVLGRRVDRDPLRSYARLEAATAVAALYSLAALPLLARLAPRLTTFAPGPATVLLASAAALVAFFPATFFQGATLPALVRASARRLEHAPSALGRLYAINTLGAVAGALAAGFVLPPLVGTRASIALAAGIDVLVAVAAFHLARSSSAPAPAPSPASSPPPSSRSSPSSSPSSMASHRRAPILAALALAGFAALAWETAAIRVLSAVFGSTVYSFASVVAAYLGGVALSGAACARFLRRAPSPAWLGWAAAAQAMLLAAGAHLRRVAGPLHLGLRSTFGDGFGASIAAEGVTALVVALPAAFPTTFIFCALAPRAVADESRLGGGIGAALLANTIGCALAPLCAGLVLLPLGGSRATLIAAVATLGAAAACVTILVSARGLPLLVAGASILVATSLPPQLFTWPEHEGRTTLFVAEGAAGVVTVEEERGGTRVLRTGADLFEGGDTSVFAQGRQGHLPMLLHPHPRRVLVLGVGTGGTLGAAARHPGVEVDAVELLGEVIDVLHYFDRTTGRVLDLPSVHIHQADARSFVRAQAAQGEKYDVIIADLFHPQQAGVGNLYTREHFAAIKSALADGGLFVQWLPLHELPPAELATLVRTFVAVFPSASAWLAHFNARTCALGLLGSERPLPLVWDDVVSRASALRPLVGDYLLDRPLEIFGGLLMGPGALARLAGDGPLHTDDRPLIDWLVPLHRAHDPALRLRGVTTVLDAAFPPEDAAAPADRDPSDGLVGFGPDPATASRRRASLGAYRRAIAAAMRGQRAIALGDLDAAISSCQLGIQAVPDFKLNYLVLEDVAWEFEERGMLERAQALWSQVLAFDPGDAEARRGMERVRRKMAR
jgi:spermidine synthase